LTKRTRHARPAAVSLRPRSGKRLPGKGVGLVIGVRDDANGSARVQGACKESCVRNAVWVYPITFLPYGDSRMDATLKLKAEQLASEIASEAKTLDDVNGLFRTLMKSALERMLDTEMDVHLGRKASVALPANDVSVAGPATPA